MKRLLLLAMAALLLTACSVDEEESNYLEQPSTNNVESAFEGVWSIDGTPLPSTYTVTLTQHYAHFTTFPYHDVAEHFMATISSSTQNEGMDGTDFYILEPATPPALYYMPVGYTASYNYNEIVPPSDTSYFQSLTFGLTNADAQQLTVTLNLVPSLSTIVRTSDELSCILTINQMTITFSDGQQLCQVFNPTHQLTFTSTKKTM